MDLISIVPLEFFLHGAAGLLGMAKIMRAFKVAKVRGRGFCAKGGLYVEMVCGRG